MKTTRAGKMLISNEAEKNMICENRSIFAFIMGLHETSSLLNKKTYVEISKVKKRMAIDFYKTTKSIINDITVFGRC